jgi:hypothetical protein
VSPLHLFAGELTLKNNQVFVGEIISDSDQLVKFRWKDKVYYIPKYDIEKIDRKKSGNHKSFEIIVIEMKDGSILRGIQIESNQNTVTLSNDLGLIKIDPGKISRKSKEPLEDFSPDTKYLSQKNIFSSDLIYLSGNFSFISGGLPFKSLVGFRLGYEPNFMVLNENFRFGISLDGKVGTSTNEKSSNLNFASVHPFFKIHKKLNNTFLIFSEVGPTFNAISYKDSSQNIGGFNLGVGVGLGIQYFLNEESGIQIAIRENFIPESSIQILISQLDIGYFHLL